VPTRACEPYGDGATCTIRCRCASHTPAATWPWLSKDWKTHRKCKDATLRFTARRTAFALVIAVGTIAAPAAFTVAFNSPGIVAEPNDCVTNATPGNNSLECAPAVVPQFGAPSEEQLTDTNPGINSPVRGGPH